MPAVHHSIAETNIFFWGSPSFQNVLDLLIGNFNLSAHLWVIQGGNFMRDEILLHQLLKNLVAKMLTSITYNCSRHTETSKDNVFQKLDHNSVVIGLARNRLYLLGHIVHSNQDVEIAKGVQERSHKINAPHFKNLNTQNGTEGHRIPPRNTP
jgi:hypothetical protein